MPEFTITAAAHKRDLPAKEGFKPSQVISLTLTDGTNTHEAEWITGTTIDPDALVGTRKTFTLESSQYGLKAKADRPGGFGGGGGFKPRDPKTESAIQRQHSQHMAVLLLQAKATAGALDTDDLKPSKVKALTDWFDDDIAAGVERKHPTPGMVKGLPVRNEPERTGAPEATTPSAQYEQPTADGTEPFAA